MNNDYLLHAFTGIISLTWLIQLSLKLTAFFGTICGILCVLLLNLYDFIDMLCLSCRHMSSEKAAPFQNQVDPTKTSSEISNSF